MTTPCDYMAEARDWLAANPLPTGDALYLRAATEWGQIVVDLAQYLVGRRSANYARDCAVRLLACCLAMDDESTRPRWGYEPQIEPAAKEIRNGMDWMRDPADWAGVASVLHGILTALDAPTPPPGWEVRP